jgi:hypothetical protein
VRVSSDISQVIAFVASSPVNSQGPTRRSYAGMFHTTSSSAATVRRSVSVHAGVAAVTARSSASRRRWSTATNVGSCGASTASRAANDRRDEKTRAVMAARLSRSTSS